MFTWLNAVPLLGEYEHLASYLKEMMSTISLRLIFRKNEKFGDLLNKVRIQLQPFDTVFTLALLYSCFVWIRTPEWTSLSFEE